MKKYFFQKNRYKIIIVKVFVRFSKMNFKSMCLPIALCVRPGPQTKSCKFYSQSKFKYEYPIMGHVKWQYEQMNFILFIYKKYIPRIQLLILISTCDITHEQYWVKFYIVLYSNNNKCSKCTARIGCLF